MAENGKKRVFLIPGLALVMVAVAVSLFGALPALADEGGSTYALSIIPGKTELAPGEETTITVSLANYTDLGLKAILDFSIEILIDTDKLEFAGTPTTMSFSNNWLIRPRAEFSDGRNKVTLYYLSDEEEGFLERTASGLFSFRVKAKEDLPASAEAAFTVVFKVVDAERNEYAIPVKIPSISVVVPPTTYTVTFNPAGGSAVTSQTVEEGKTATKPADPTRNGFTFLGWYLNGSAYNFSAPVTGDITLVAQWEEIITPPTYYNVTFNSNGGSSMTSQSVEAGKTATKPTDPTRAGYTFLGWFLNGSAYNFSAPVTGDINLAAQWEEFIIPPTTYTVAFNPAGGSTVASQTVEDGKTATKPADPSKEGYTFLGWYLNGNAYDFAAPVTSDITLVAQWEEKDGSQLPGTGKKPLNPAWYIGAAAIVLGIGFYLRLRRRQVTARR